MPPTERAGEQEGSTVSRRRLLAVVGGAAVTTTIAGCGSTSDSTPPEREPDLTLTDVRVVQNVEDTDLSGGGQSQSDPPLIAGEYATVMFDLETTHPDNLPDEFPVAVTSRTTDFGYVHRVSKADAQAINDGADAAAVFHETANSTGPGEPPGVKRLPADIGDITIKAIANHMDGDEVTLTEGSSGDFEVTEHPPLRVGFLNVVDPGGTHSPYYTSEAHASLVGDVYETDIDWGDSNGETVTYERSVRSSFEYLKRAYPGQVVAYSHDVDIAMVGVIRENWSDGTGFDAWRARRALNMTSSDSSFPAHGTIHTDEHVTRQEAIDMMNLTVSGSDGGALPDIDPGGFDVRVMILPRGTATGNQNYFAAHGMDYGGYFWSVDQAVGSLETQSGPGDIGHATTTAQEIGHRYSDALYRTSGSHPLARKADLDEDGDTDVDSSHANGNLVSTAYDLSGETYSVVSSYTLRDGSFSPGSPRRRVQAPPSSGSRATCPTQAGTSGPTTASTGTSWTGATRRGTAAAPRAAATAARRRRDPSRASPSRRSRRSAPSRTGRCDSTRRPP